MGLEIQSASKIMALLLQKILRRNNMKLIVFLVVMTLSGCHISSKFKPIPDAYLLWTKPGATELDVKKALMECGKPSPAPSAYGPDVAHMSLNDKALANLCMIQAGFTYHDPFKMNSSYCKLEPSLPACQPGAEIPKPSKERRLKSEYCKIKTNYDYCVKHAPYPEGCSNQDYANPSLVCLP